MLNNKTVKVQVIVLFSLILANFIAQVAYYLRLYYNPSDLLTPVRGILVMLLVFAFFLLASMLLFRGKALGYWLMLVFVAVEFFFYLGNAIGEVTGGHGLFFHLANPDLVLKTIFAIGYLNLFASAYLLGLLLLQRKHFLAPLSDIASATRRS
jgi:hypothetical protein